MDTTTSEKKTFTCQTCGEKKTSRSAMKQHRRRHNCHPESAAGVTSAVAIVSTPQPSSLLTDPAIATPLTSLSIRDPRQRPVDVHGSQGAKPGSTSLSSAVVRHVVLGDTTHAPLKPTCTKIPWDLPLPSFDSVPEALPEVPVHRVVSLPSADAEKALQVPEAKEEMLEPQQRDYRENLNSLVAYTISQANSGLGWLRMEPRIIAADLRQTSYGAALSHATVWAVAFTAQCFACSLYPQLRSETNVEVADDQSESKDDLDAPPPPPARIPVQAATLFDQQVAVFPFGPLITRYAMTAPEAMDQSVPVPLPERLFQDCELCVPPKIVTARPRSRSPGCAVHRPRRRAASAGTVSSTLLPEAPIRATDTRTVMRHPSPSVPRPRVRAASRRRARRPPVASHRNGRLAPVVPRPRRLRSVIVPPTAPKSQETEFRECRDFGPPPRRRCRLADRSPPAAAAAASDLDLLDELDVPELEFVLDLQE